MRGFVESGIGCDFVILSCDCRRVDVVGGWLVDGWLRCVRLVVGRVVGGDGLP